MIQNENMANVTVREKYGVTYLTFPLLEQAGVVHGFSTRLGGVSCGDCSQMNLSFTRGDRTDDVLENHRRFAKAVGYRTEHLVLSDQIHETMIRRTDRTDCGKGITKESDIIGVDGLITDDPQVVLMTFFADCVPLFFYDPVNRAAGAVHSGWRGTVKRIGQIALERMNREFGTSPEEVLAVIGPSICQDCYEVGEETAKAFQDEFAKEQWDQILIKKPNEKYQLDLWRANEIILQEAGIKDENVQVSGLCTCCHPKLLFSHRATGGKRGNLAGVITLGDRYE